MRLEPFPLVNTDKARCLNIYNVTKILVARNYM